MNAKQSDPTIPSSAKSNRALFARTPLTAWLAAAALGGVSLAGDAGEVKTPRALPDMSGVTMQAEPVTKDGAQRVEPRRKREAPMQPQATSNAQAKLPNTNLSAVTRGIDHSQVDFRATEDHALWARGTAFKSEFRADRATFVPFFGASAPKNFPIAFHVERMTVGGQAVSFAASAEVARDGQRVSMQRGAVVEQYDVTPGAMEQRFVFDSLPSGGDLELRIGFQTELAASAGPRGIEFTNELGSVHYSSAVALDANGARSAAATVLDGDTIVITVPASFIAGATFPLTIDPVIDTIMLFGNSWENTLADVAYDHTTKTYFVVYQERYSENDHDAYAAEFDVNGNLIYWASLDVSFDDWTHMAAANNGIADQFLVVADANAAGHHSVKGIEVSAATFAAGPTFTIADSPGGSCLNPDVGGDPSPVAPTYYCVTWERVDAAGEHDIQARMVTSAGTLLGPGPIQINNTTGTIDSLPSISKCDGNAPTIGQEWMIVWQREYSVDDHDIHGARIAWDGIITQSSFAIESSANNDTSPCVSSPTDWNATGRRHLVVFEREYDYFDHDIWCALVKGISVLDATNLSVMETPFLTWYDQLRPSVDSDGEQFAIAFTEKDWWYFQYTLVIACNGAGDKIGLSDERNQLSYYWADNTAITAVHSGGAVSTRYMAVYDQPDSGYSTDIYGDLYEGPAGGPVYEFCGASNFACPCGNGGALGNGCASSVNPQGAHLAASGTASVVHDSLVLSGTGMPGSSTCIYLQGDTAVSALFGDGWRCAGGQLIRIATDINSGGASSYPQLNQPRVSVKGQVPANGGTRFYQTYYRDPASFCTPLTYNITNAVSVTWVP